MVHYRRGVVVSPDRGWPKRLVNERTTPPVHIQDGSGWGQVPPLGWREREEEYSCRRPERQTRVEEVDSAETEACKSRKFDKRRLFNPDIKEYTLLKRNPVVARRLDYILTSSTVFDKTRVRYYFGPSVINHRGCGIVILFSEVVKGPGYWKFNNSLLEDINHVNQMNELIDSFIRGDNNANQDQQSWQLLKLRMKLFSMR